MVTVQRALGHSKPTTTLNTYAHLWPTAEDRTRKAAQRPMKVSVPRDLRTICGLEAPNKRLACENSSIQTLKRNSTTSPSAIT